MKSVPCPISNLAVSTVPAPSPHPASEPPSPQDFTCYLALKSHGPCPIPHLLLHQPPCCLPAPGMPFYCPSPRGLPTDLLPLLPPASHSRSIATLTFETQIMSITPENLPLMSHRTQDNSQIPCHGLWGPIQPPPSFLSTVISHCCPLIHIFWPHWSPGCFQNTSTHGFSFLLHSPCIYRALCLEHSSLRWPHGLLLHPISSQTALPGHAVPSCPPSCPASLPGIFAF